MPSLINMISWSFLIFILLCATFGANIVILFILSLTIIFLALCLSLKYHLDYQLLEIFTLNLLSTRRMIKLIKCNLNENRKFNLNESLTGDVFIDEQLEEINELIFRDIIVPWYSSISHRKEFIDEIKIIIQMITRNISSRIKRIDKVGYMTTQLVDDFASHLRLYRLTEQRLKILKKEDPNNRTNLISLFFDLEFQMEKYKLCRDDVCENKNSLNTYLTHITDLLQYLLLTPDAFDNRLIRYSLEYLSVNSILLPFFEIISDPDFVNQALVWLCKSKVNNSSTPEIFLTVLRCCDDRDELNAVLEIVDREISVQRSKDTGGDDDFEIKQQLSGLLFVQSVIKSKLNCLNKENIDENDSNLQSNTDYNKLTNSGSKLFQIPFEVMLKNNIALSYFIEYMSSIGYQGYVYFYLNVEGFRISAEQQLTASSKIEVNKSQNCASLREAAINIYDTYLNPNKKSPHKLKVDEIITNEIENRIKAEMLCEDWFDKAHKNVFDLMKRDPMFFPSFKKSIHYVKLLAELDLLKESSNNNNYHRRQKSNDVELIQNTFYDEDIFYEQNMIQSSEVSNEINSNLPIKAEISNTGIVREFGNTYGVYCINVCKKVGNENEKWCVLRRYSDFDSFHQLISEKFDIEMKCKLSLPGKKAFNNTSQEFLEQRRHLLNSYLQQVVAKACDRGFKSGLKEHLMKFLEPGNYEKEKAGQFTKAVNNLVLNPFKSSVKTVSTVVKAGSDNIKDSFQKLARLGSLSTNFQSRPSTTFCQKSTSRRTINNCQTGIVYPEINSNKFGAALETINDIDNIPLRIMLLLMDEVFDLKSKDQWLRRRIVNVIRQVIKATFGDTINRKIIDYIEELTSSLAISDYIRSVKNYFWPNNCKLITFRGERDQNKKMRTRVAAKLLLLSAFSDDLKHIIGTETTRKGLLNVFNMFQHETLNRRLVLVLFENLIIHLFPDNHLPLFIERIYSCSSRTKEWNKANNIKNNWPPYLYKMKSDKKVSLYSSSTSCSPVHRKE